MTDIYQSIRAVQIAFNAPKSHYNSFGDYYYRSAEDMEAGLKPLLDEHNLTMLIDDEVVEIGGRFYVKSTVSVHQGVAVVQAHGYAREVEQKTKSDPAQITGMASSYARKYALGGLFLVDDQPDADSQNGTVDPLAEAKQKLWEASEKSNTTASFLTEPEHPEEPQWYLDMAALWTVIKAYAQRHNAQPKTLLEGVRKRSNYEETHDFYSSIISEFEAAC